MGIKGLGKLITQYSPSSIQDYNNLRGSKFVLDVYILLYSTMIASRKYNYGRDVKTSMGRVSSHITGMFYKILSFINTDVETLWVFDGPPPEIKKDLMRKRSCAKQRAKNELLLTERERIDEYFNSLENSVDSDGEYQDVEVYKNFNRDSDIKNRKKTVEISKSIVHDVQTLLELFGISYIVAISEGEMQCAAFSNTYGAVSDDWDTLVFGSSNMIKNIKFHNKRYTKISLSSILFDLDLTHTQFVELCILLGCDYCPRIKGIDFDIYQQYRIHKNVDSFINFLHDENERLGEVKYHIPDNYYATFSNAKNFYIHGEIIDPYSVSLSPEWKEPRYDELTSFLCDDFEMDRTMVISNLEVVKRKFNQYKAAQERKKSFRDFIY
jgi:flap endonuclease-1